MNIVRREMEKKFAEGVASMKADIRRGIIEAIKEGESESGIQRLIRAGKFSDEEVAAIYNEAKGG